MKQYIALASLLFNTVISFGQGWEWQRYGRKDLVVTNQAGDVFNAGHFTDSISIQKFSKKGTLLWQKALKGPLTLAALELDKGGNLLIAGTFSSTVSIDSWQLVSNGAMNSFLIRLDEVTAAINGSVVLGSSGQTFVKDCFVNDSNDYVVAGCFIDSTILNGHTIPGDTFYNAFLAKLDDNFDVLWSEKSTCITSYCGEVAQIEEIVETKHGNYYLVLNFQGCLVEIGEHPFENSGRYLVRLNSSRKVTWVSYLEYPDFFLTTSDLQCSGDTAFLKRRYDWKDGTSIGLSRWVPDSGQISGSTGFSTNNLAYDILNGKLYCVFAEHRYGSESSLYDRRNFEILTTQLKSVYQCSDSLIFPYKGHPTLYNDLAVLPDENAVYVCGQGEELASDQFLGKYNFELLTNTIELISKPVTIFPNPSQDFLNINIEGDPISTIKIYSAIGETVYHRQVTADHKTIDISALKAGSYVLRLYSRTNIYTHKFVKLDRN